jgi:hypothetical protein
MATDVFHQHRLRRPDSNLDSTDSPKYSHVPLEVVDLDDYTWRKCGESHIHRGCLPSAKRCIYRILTRYRDQFAPFFGIIRDTAVKVIEIPIVSPLSPNPLLVPYFPG